MKKYIQINLTILLTVMLLATTFDIYGFGQIMYLLIGDVWLTVAFLVTFLSLLILPNVETID